MIQLQMQSERRMGRSKGLQPASSFIYRTYGLTVTSQLELPELSSLGPDAKHQVDVEIRMGEPTQLQATSAELADGICVRGDVAQFVVDGVARYSIERGRRIIIDRRVCMDNKPPPGPEDVRLYALGSAMGALLYQRGIMPLHASALETPSGIWAFTGPSGAGKSTLAAWLSQRHGWPLVCDDVLAAHPTDNSFRFHPGPPRAKLWKDALTALGMSSEGLMRDQSRADKYHVRIASNDLGGAGSLRGLVFLNRSTACSQPRLEPIVGIEAYRNLLTALYRPSFATRLAGSRELFAQCASLARSIPMYSLTRPWDLGSMASTVQPLVEAIQQAR